MNALSARRALPFVVVAALCAGCLARTIPTPSTPLTYGWVMAHDHAHWGVQIGPKVDGSGTHVAVYAWQGCDGTVCTWEHFTEYDELQPGSSHNYDRVWTARGWSMRFDGREVIVLNVGNPQTAIYEDTLTTGPEHTTR